MKKLFLCILFIFVILFCYLEYLCCWGIFDLTVVRKQQYNDKNIYLLMQGNGVFTDDTFFLAVHDKDFKPVYYRSDLFNSIYFYFNEKPLYLCIFSFLGDESEIKITRNQQTIIINYVATEDNNDNYFANLDANKCVHSKDKITCSL
jgi:hypothetical protein